MPQQILSVRDLEVVYADVILALRGVTIEVTEGSIVALLGANGAGKTTLLRAISGLLGGQGGRIRRGSVAFIGRDLAHRSAPQIVRAGMAQVMEGRRIFAELTVDENLRAGAFTRTDKAEIRQNYEWVLSLFPKLAERRRNVAGYLSGGEQQMLAIGRALMASPKLLLLDEPSLGLAPLIVAQIRDIILEINKTAGTSVLLVEQNATMALSIATHGYVLENGTIARSDTGPALLADASIQEAYLGTGETGRTSFRALKEQYRAARTGAAP
ncbi:MAG: ABC transporter ATP-binding protein [Acidimicrobiia bacterium]